MAIGEFGKRIISLLLAATVSVPTMTGVLAANEEATLIFKEDFQSIESGSLPSYGASNWTGDTSGSHSECSVKVVDERGNKSFRMQYEADGSSVTADPLIYRNISVGKNETYTFYMSLKTDDINSYKEVFLRASTGSKLSLFKINGDSIEVIGMSVAGLKKSTWYDLKFVIKGADKSVDVYLNGAYSGTMTITSTWDITNMSLRVSMMGATAEGATTNIYIDNTAYTKGDMPVEFEVPEVVDATPTPAVEGEEVPTSSVPLPMSSETVFCLDNSKVYSNGQLTDTGIRTMVYRGNTMIPVRNIANIFGGTVEWNDDGYALLKVNGKEAKVYHGKVEIDGKESDVFVKPVNMDGTMYIGTETAALITGKQVSEETNGAVVFFDSEKNDSTVSTILDKMVYTEPSAEAILADFKKNNPDNVHPRILMDGARLSKIKELLTTDENFISWYKNVKKAADKALTAPLCKYELRDGERLLYVSRDVYANVVYPSFVYLIEGDRKYFERAVAELTAAAAFEDWHPTHFLDTAEMTLAFAIGYDWLYDSLSKKQKKTISEAILRLGLDAADEAYEGTATYNANVSGAYHNRIGWKNDASNWGLVCNGGIAAGACAIIGDYESEYCAEIISKSLKSIKRPLQIFAPDGAWDEGVGYWDYACEYFAYHISSVTNTIGTDYGYTMIPGLLGSAYFPVYLTGPTGAFNYADMSESSTDSPILFWFADALDDPALNDARLGMMEKFGLQGGMSDILFYNPDMELKESVTEKDKKFRKVEVSVSTSSSANPNANYIAIKGGKVGASHGDLDAGVFIIDALGERWANDWGRDDYTLPGYFFWPQRADYYRKRAEGHNVIVFNPDGEPEQIVGAETYIDEFVSGVSGSCSVVDTSTAYKGDAKSTKRAAVLYDDRSKMMVQDEVVCDTPTDVYWFMQTKKQNIEIAPDGKSLVISDGNSSASAKRLKMVIQSNCATAKFTYGEAEPLPQSPKGAGQASNMGGKRIQILCSGVTNLNLQVIFVPFIEAEGEPNVELPSLMTIDELVNGKNIDFNSQTYTYLDDLKVDGKSVNLFDSVIKYYDIDVDIDATKVPVVEAISDRFNVEVKNSEEIGDTAVVTVTDPEGKLKPSKYYITQNVKRVTYDFDDSWKSIKAVGVEASDVPEAQNTPENTIDGDAATKWAAEGEQWIKYDLGSVQPVKAIGLLWMSSASRVQNYSVDISDDGSNWTTIFNDKSLGTASAMEYLKLVDTETRYIRIGVKGTNVGTWTSLQEIEFFVK